LPNRCKANSSDDPGGVDERLGLAALADIPLLAIPFTTSIVLVIAAPENQQAQPRNILGGHILSALCGLGVLAFFGSTPWLAALAVGVSIAAMQVTRTLHPPAGMNALLMVTTKASWTFVLMPITVGALVLVAFAFAFHRVTRRDPWPRDW